MDLAPELPNQEVAKVPASGISLAVPSVRDALTEMEDATMQLGRKAWTATCVSLFLVGIYAAPAGAQAIHEGKVTGTVVTEDNVGLPDATVEITSPALIAGKQTTTT